ncbi:hypothetical protein P353_19660 [Comamonas testosteroni]|uniref:Uncharacterized protein n=1 Tax=Comamonas testosteroni TaxID=285 RepID=A0A096HDS7_COMTE|nr:hypothetical protein P353_19660 [Comamonas testosteroni]
MRMGLVLAVLHGASGPSGCSPITTQSNSAN